METEQLLPLRIRALDNQIRRLFDRSAIVENDAGLTGMQYAVLRYITGQDKSRAVFQRDIEAAFNIRRSTATGMLQMLEKAGYIRRVPVPDDARLKKIVLTDRGRILEEQANTTILNIQEKLIRGIPREEMEVFYRVLQKLSDNARA